MRTSPRIDDCGPSTGALTPSGICSPTAASFSLTIWRARYISVPQSNSTQTTEKPWVDCDLTRRTPVLPFTAVSIGKVTSCSTSSAAIPPASVIMTTVGALRSGKTSTSVLLVEYSPAMTSRTAATRTSILFSSENLIILFSIIYNLSVT